MYPLSTTDYDIRLCISNRSEEVIEPDPDILLDQDKYENVILFFFDKFENVILFVYFSLMLVHFRDSTYNRILGFCIRVKIQTN